LDTGHELIDVMDDIRQVTLDSFLGHDVDDIDLIKIDVEGYENEVLNGAMKIIETQKPDIFLELHGGLHLNDKQHHPNAIHKFLTEIMSKLSLLGYDYVNMTHQDILDRQFSNIHVILSCRGGN
jgi:hypothetical protein